MPNRYGCALLATPVGMVGRLFGGVFVTLGVIPWLARDFRDEAAVRAVLIGVLIGDVVNLVVATIPNQTVGHAVAATGQILNDKLAAQPLPAPGAEFSEAFFVNDDQVGPNVIMPVKTGGAIGQAM